MDYGSERCEFCIASNASRRMVLATVTRRLLGVAGEGPLQPVESPYSCYEGMCSGTLVGDELPPVRAVEAGRGWDGLP